MKKIQSVYLTILALFFFASCSNDPTIMRKKVTGKAGEVVIVISKKTWESQAGSKIRKILAQPQLGLPQDEPIFELIDVPPAAFKEIFKTSRNIITVKIMPGLDSAKVQFKKDVWAWPQAVINIQAKSHEQFVEAFTKSSDKIVAYFIKAERDRLLMNYTNYHDKAVKNIIQDKFGFDLNLPPGFKVTKTKDNFAWIRYETPEISQGIIIQTYPYTSDSTFTPNYLLDKRDSILKKYIDGPTNGSYMTTEHQLPPVFNVFSFKNNYAAEMRGLWKVENDFMGGPFVNLTVLDASNNRIVMLDGYVYAPRFDKRNYLRQVEAMMYSLRFPHQAKNDKISSEIKMGN